jgi:hypothetical protein
MYIAINSALVCDVNGISEKAFKKLDDTKEYLEKFFDNNPEILLDIDKMNDKRYQYTGEFIYDKYFNNASNFCLYFYMIEFF